MKRYVRIDSQILSTLGRCSREAQLRFLENLEPMERRIAFDRGSQVHAAFQTYYGMLKEGFHFKDARDKALQDSLAFAMTTEIENPEVMRVQGIIEEYFEYRKDETWIPLAVEQGFSQILYDSDELQILYEGRIDLIVENSQEMRFPVDHKTTSMRTQQTELQNQFMGYCWATGCKQFVINDIGLHKSRMKPDERFQRIVLSYNQTLLDEWQYSAIATIKQWVQAMEANIYQPNFANCQRRFGSCDFVKVCCAEPDFRVEVIKREFNVRDEWDPLKRDYDNVASNIAAQSEDLHP